MSWRGFEAEGLRDEVQEGGGGLCHLLFLSASTWPLRSLIADVAVFRDFSLSPLSLRASNASPS